MTVKFEKLFESLDDKVFTTELKESLEVSFNEAVESKSEIIAEARIEEEVDTLSEKSEAHIEFLSEKAEEFIAMKQEEMLESVDKYLERVVEEFVSDAKGSLDESIKSEKADLIIEAFDSILLAAGVEVSSIVEAKDESSVEKDLAESVSKYDTVIDENIALKEEVDALVRMGVIAELSAGLTIVESAKFLKLAELVEFTKDASFAEKLEVIKESVKGSVELKETKETKETIETKLNEDEKSSTLPDYSHLL